MASQSKIKSYTFANSWDPKNGDPIRHIYNALFENGEGGKHYSLVQNPPEFKPGVECTYKIINGQVKDLVVFNPSPVVNNPSSNNSYGNGAIAGYAVRHATDLVVGEITAKTKFTDPKIQDPIARIKKYSEELYSWQLELGTRPF